MTWSRICGVGFTDRDIDALGDYWDVFPALRSQLFSANGREGYSDVRVEAGSVRSVVLQNEEFKAYKDRIGRVLGDWREEHAPRLRGLEVGDLPKALIRDLAEDLLRRFVGLPLLGRYVVYQCVMDYWDEVMQDDVYLVVTEGGVLDDRYDPPSKAKNPTFLVGLVKRLSSM